VSFTACFDHKMVVTHLVEKLMADETVTTGDEDSSSVFISFCDFLLLRGKQLRADWLGDTW